MTLADDFLNEEKVDEEYPTAFGITFTPVVSGLALAVLGVVGAAYIFMNMVKPVQESYQQVKSQQQEKQTQLDQIKNGDLQQQFANLNGQLAAKKAQKSQILTLFTDENDLDTLLLDLSSFIAANQGTLVKYSPDTNVITIQDGSLGNEVNGKLKRTSISLEIEGTYGQTQAILRDIELLQPLLIVQNYSSKVSEQPAVILSSTNGELVPSREAVLTTQLKIDAILPLSQKELEQAKQQEEENNKDKQDKKQK
jgi:hypothetical protein